MTVRSSGSSTWSWPFSSSPPMPTQAPRGSRLIAEAVSETRQAIQDLRELGAGLHPSVLTHRGLRAAISSLTARAPVPVTLEIAAERFAPIVEATAYFVVAEALANVAKHADDAEAGVTVATHGQRPRSPWSTTAGVAL